jgi:hypothetical protein
MGRRPASLLGCLGSGGSLDCLKMLGGRAANLALSTAISGHPVLAFHGPAFTRS